VHPRVWFMSTIIVESKRIKRLQRYKL
jgi:hypothetical protein